MALNFVINVNEMHVETGTPDVPANTPQITVAAWVRPTFFDTDARRIISKAANTGANNHTWMVGSNAGANLRTRIGAGNSTTTLQAGVMTLGIWQHVAVVYDGANQFNYINGVAQGSAANSGDVDIDPAFENWIGMQPGSGASDNEAWDGDIADVRIYTRALSPIELRHITLSFGGDGITTGIFLWWRLQEFHAGVVATLSNSVKQIAPGTPGTSRFDGTPVNSPVYVNDVIRWRGAYNH